MIDLTKALEHCPHCISDKRTLNAVLKDLYPSEKRMIHILITLYECGIAATMKSKGCLDAIEKSRFSARLENQYAIPEQFSQEGIRIWEAAADNVVKALETNAVSSPIEPITTIESPLYMLNKGVDRKSCVAAKKHIKAIRIILVSLTALVIGLLALNAVKKEQNYYGEYYLTLTGSKYHVKQCIHIEGKTNVHRMTIDEFESGEYAPCRVCLSHDLQ